MIRKRSPQEIADFFQCYVVQASKYEGSSFRCSDEKPKFGPDGEYWVLKRWVEIPDELIKIPENHIWTQLYEPQPYSVEAPVSDNEGSSYSKESVFIDNKPDHASEVFIHKEYVVAEGRRTQDLSKKVNMLLNHGWKLQGGVAVEYLPESDGYKEGSEIFYQAMVRGL